MPFDLSDVEVRIVGALMEKEKTTPEYYPMTLNGLTRACTQKSNRHPVMELEEKTVAYALDGLGFHKKLTKRVLSDDSRVPKYRHAMTEVFNLNPMEYAALCVLMLRGSQTLGEIRGRSERLFTFETLEDVEGTLQTLSGREEPLVMKLPRQPGRKEARYAHLLSGEIDVEELSVDELAVIEVRAENERITQLEQEVEALRGEVAELKVSFAQFKQQFE